MTCSHLTPSNTTTSYPSQSENIQACELLPEWKSCECCANGFVGYDKHDGPFTYCINGISMIATPLSDGKTCDDPQVGSLKSSPTWNLKTISQWMAAKQGTLVGADGEPLDEGDAVQEQLLGLDGKPIPKGTMLPVEGSGFTTLWSDESDPATSGPVSAFEEGGTYSFYVRQDETDTTTRPEAPQASPCPVWKKTTLSEVVYAVSAGYVLRSETLKGADSPDYIRNILCPKHGDTAYLTGVRKGLFVYDENNTLADDDGTVLGNWIRQAEYEVYPAWWGATEALADNGPMFNSAFAHMLTSDRILKIPGRYRINSEPDL